MKDREARFRRLLKAYPKAYRAVREDEILATLLDTTAPEQRGPKLRDVLDVGLRGMQLRLTSARRHPLWVATVCLVAASVGVALALSAVSAPRPFAAYGVRWLNDPVSPSYAHSLTVAKPLPKPRRSAPPCKADQLEFVRGAPDVSGGMRLFFGLTFRNVGTASCIVRGTPTVTAYSATYPPLVGSRGSPAETMFFGEVTDTPPGGTVLVELTDFLGCEGGELSTYNELLFGFPDGGSVALHVDYGDFCDDLVVSPFFTPEPQPTFYTFPTDVLRAHMRMPTTVQHGSTLIYDIELSNPTSSPVAFSPCPAYEVWAASPVTRVPPAYYRLDCRGVPPLAPHHDRFFQMQLHVPAHGAGRNLWVYWKLVSLMAVASTWGHTTVT